MVSNGYDYGKITKSISDLDEVVIEERLEATKDKPVEFSIFNLIYNSIRRTFQHF